MLRITIWNENRHETQDEAIRKVYPIGIHGALASIFEGKSEYAVRTATLDEPNCGLGEGYSVLDDTDVLLWWGHMAHGDVPDALADKVARRVNEGMGLVALHSAHESKMFMKLMGTRCGLRWRHGARERVWCINPAHPIAAGLPDYFELPEEEMYGEFFDIPTPEQLIFIGWFNSGEVFRSGITFTRGYGKIFYFQPGHEEYPIYYNENVRKVILNGVNYVRPTAENPVIGSRMSPSLEG